MKRLLIFVALLALTFHAAAATFAIPDGSGGYTYVDQNDPRTISIGSLSFPAPWLAQSTQAQRDALGILTVVETNRPDPATNAVAGSSIQVVGGVPTVVWSSAPLSAPQLAANAYAALVAAGFTLLSTGTPSLNGTYDVDVPQQGHINSQISAILLNGTFTNGLGTRVWPDRTGTLHTFDVPHFKAFATQVGMFIDAAILAEETQAAGGTPSWPQASATIQ